jgi:hypothetical protein
MAACPRCRQSDGQHDRVYRLLAQVMGLPVHPRAPVGEHQRKQIAALAVAYLQTHPGVIPTP